MGERQNDQRWLFEPEFNRAVKVQTTDQRITSDAGLLLLREADHRLGLCEHLAGKLVDPRRPDRIRYELVELLRERLYGLALGYTTQDDADRLAHDPAMKLAAWNAIGPLRGKVTRSSSSWVRTRPSRGSIRSGWCWWWWIGPIPRRAN